MSMSKLIFFAVAFFSIFDAHSDTVFLSYGAKALLKDCQKGYEVCWPVISSVISSGQIYVAERQTEDIKYCLPWDMSYSYGTMNNPYGGESNPGIRDKIIGIVVSHIENDYKSGEVYEHIQTAAGAVIVALHDAYPCNKDPAVKDSVKK